MNTMIQFHEGINKKETCISIVYDTTQIVLDLGENLNTIDFDTYDTTIFISNIENVQVDKMASLKNKAPIYVSSATNRLIKALDQLNDRTHEDYQEMQLNETVVCGNIYITNCFSDYPCFGGVGYLIETPDTTIYYTADTRFHGLQKDRAFAQLEIVKNLQIDILIVDATLYTKEMIIEKANDHLDIVNEGDIYKDIESKIASSQQAAIFDANHFDMQLLKGMKQISDAVHRTLVLDIETSYVLNSLLYAKCPYYIGNKQLNEALQAFRQKNPNEIPLEALQYQSNQFFIQGNKEIMELLDYKQGDYFHFKKEVEISGLQSGMMLHDYTSRAKSHILPQHIDTMIKEINPKTVIALHTNIEDKWNEKQCFPNAGKWYIINDGKIIEKGE